VVYFIWLDLVGMQISGRLLRSYILTLEQSHQCLEKQRLKVGDRARLSTDLTDRTGSSFPAQSEALIRAVPSA
jgi:hypothetical protein